MSDFTLIETMRFEPAQGLLRGNLHRARLSNSARRLGFCGHEAAWRKLLSTVEAVDAPARVRLELARDGRCEVQIAPFSLQTEESVWRVKIATSTMIPPRDPLLAHKTSLRKHYEKARDEYSKAEAEEVLLMNESGEICEGTITNVFVPAGGDHLLTPPLSSGCLAGVLRTSLICAGRARPAPISREELSASEFFVGNSLRGLIRARLA